MGLHEGGASLLRRQRLIDILRQGSHGTATVLTAPAGYGKRVAVTQWTDRLRKPPTIIRLRRDDGVALVAAQLVGLQRADAGVVVFDSLDLPTDPAVVRLVIRQIELALPSRHVVITRRSAAPGPLDGVLAGRTVTRIDHRDLRFDEAEVRQLLAGMGVEDVTEAEVHALLDRTRGWPIAVHLVAASLQLGDRDDAMERIRGPYPQLEGFMRSEVLDWLPQRSRRFLVRTSVVPEVSGPLCDAVTGDAGSEALLAELEADGLLLRAAPGTVAVRRCHPLLRDLFRRELRTSTTDDEALLLRRAASWHLDRGDVEGAADLLVEGELWSELLELVDRHGRAIVGHGHAERLLAWLAAIPTTGAPWRHDVVLRRAVLLTILGRTQMAEQVIHDAALSPSVGEQAVLDTLPAAWAFLHGAPEVSVRAADAVLAVVDQLGPGDVPDLFGMTSPAAIKSLVQVGRARSQWFLGGTTVARDGLLDALRRPMAYPAWGVQSLAGLAMLEAWSGNLRLAERHTREAWRVARAHQIGEHPALCDVMLARAHVLRERGRLAQSEELLEATMLLATTFRRSTTLALLAVERALWHLAAGDPGRGLEVIEQLRAIELPPLPPVVAGRMAATELRLHLAAGDLQRAAAVPLDDVQEPAAAGAGVQLALLRGDLEGAAGIVGAWPAGDDPRASIERELWAAVLEFHSGQRRSARQRIVAVVDRAQGEGHVRLFLDGGEPVQRLLRAVAPASRSAYIAELVNAWSSTGEGGELGLSRREADVLRYLPTSLSNAEIAATLYISLNTLKTHLHSVYRKLDVTGRREAIEQAEKLGIA